MTDRALRRIRPRRRRHAHGAIDDHLDRRRAPTSRSSCHHFDDLEQQQVASNLGMWMFLATEVMFFGGLFAAYVVYRRTRPARVRRWPAGISTSGWAAINTVVLLDQQPGDGPGRPLRAVGSTAAS